MEQTMEQTINTRDVFTGFRRLPKYVVVVYRTYLGEEFVLNRQSLEIRRENIRRQGLDTSAEDQALAAWSKE